MHDHDAPHITKTLAMFNAGYLLREILSSLLTFRSKRSLTYPLVLSPYSNWTKSQMDRASPTPFRQS
jgi:hypothetical protein